MADLTLGKLQAALASATNEVTVAAANINFDFALVKLEAPPEYQPLGGILSSVRKKNAETGPVHVTARRLGALFDGICPQAPNLLKAYGHRVSEISAQATKTSGRHTSWIFPEHTGIDGTSIWAAATSSNASVHAHLLACMLARFWNEAEATSVWVEMIEERRREIAAQFEQGRAVPFASTAAATQQEISREQIANWDASARAWLRTADAVKDKQQKQLLLIIRNLSLPVNDETTPYHSVKKAWINAVETMEKIIVGGSFDVRDGAILVALSAWHLYPNMIVYGGPNSIQDVDMGDDLIYTGGVLNLGLSGGSKRLDGGVHWSLPLRHFKYYGSAVKRTRQLELDGARLSFSDLLVANLGALLESWGVPQIDTGSTFRLLLTLMSYLPISEDSNDYDEEFDLRHCIVNPIKTYFEDERHGDLLLSLGRRRQQKFALYDSLPYFGLLDLNALLNVLKGPDERIELLRRITKRYEPPPLEVLIIYSENPADGSPPNIASAMQSELQGEERAWKKVAGECRWVRDPENYRRVPNESIYPISSRFAATEMVRSMFSIPEEGKTFDLVCGESGLAEIYVQRDGLARIAATDLSLLPTDLAWCIQAHPLDTKALTRHWSSMRTPGGDGAFHQLETLSAAAYVYESHGMQGATISPRLLECALKPLWMEAHRYIHSSATVAIEEAFDIVAHFELGYEIKMQRPDREDEETLGLSAGDSLYIKQKVCVPSDSDDPAQPFDH
ncbi:hypothetical protein E8E14_008809 [Neopestalotiopsis sp. 37M]|nr:hypothetical protein E8E14_008809 [Neopestalotiopsis sp. 37M]